MDDMQIFHCNDEIVEDEGGHPIEIEATHAEAALEIYTTAVQRSRFGGKSPILAWMENDDGERIEEDWIEIDEVAA